MTSYFAICIGILTVTHVIGLVFVIYTLAQMRRSAEAVEVLAYQAQDQVEKINEATTQINSFAGSVRSGWMKIATIGLGAAVEFMSRIKQTKQKKSEEENDGE